VDLRRCRSAPRRVAKQIRQRLRILVEDPGESGTCGPTRDRLLVESRSRLVRRVPRAARMGNWQVANVARNLLALLCGEAMEARAGHNAGIGEVEVFQVAAVLRMTVRTVRLNARTVWEAVCRQWGGLPEFPPCQDGSRVGQGGVQESGASSANWSGGRVFAPSPVRKFHARTR